MILPAAKGGKCVFHTERNRAPVWSGSALLTKNASYSRVTDATIAVPFHLPGERYTLPFLHEDRVHCHEASEPTGPGG
jgi:hypothetical protein